MKNEIFNTIGYKTVNGKMVLIAVVPDDMLGDNMPDVFEIKCVRTVPTIFSGNYPTIRMLNDTIKEREDLVGMGANGILLGANWMNQSVEDKDELGINLKK